MSHRSHANPTTQSDQRYGRRTTEMPPARCPGTTESVTRCHADFDEPLVLALVKAFLKAGILDEDGRLIGINAGTPQGSILSPLLSNVALSVLDEYVAQGLGGPGASPFGGVRRRRQ